MYDGQFLIEQLTNAYWLTDFRHDSSVTWPLIATQESGTLGTVLLAPDSGWVLASIVPAYDEAWNVKPETRLVSLDNHQKSLVLSDCFPQSKPRHAIYWLSGNQRWLVGLSRTELKYWDLQAGPRPRGNGDIRGFAGQVRSSCLADQRWLVLLNEQRRAYVVDLQSESELRAVPFFQLGDGPNSPNDEIHAAGKYVLLSFAQPATACVWHVSAFEHWNPAD
jgi:hypothetical protein